MAVTIRYGYFDRGGVPADSQGGNSGWRAKLGGFVVNGATSPQGGIALSEFYSTSTAASVLGSTPGTKPLTNGGHAGNGTDAIDNAFSIIDAYNHANPSALQWSAKLRIFSGIYQPAALKKLYGTVANNGATLSPYWTTNYRNFWKNFTTQLWLYVPQYTVAATGLANTVPLGQHPLLGEIAVSGAMTTYAEPMLLSSTVQGSPWSAAGMGTTNAALQNALQNILQDTQSIFNLVPCSVSSNPCAYGGNQFTNNFNNFQTQNGPPPFGVLENNSLRANNTQGVTGIGVTGPFTGNDPNSGVPWYIFAAGASGYEDGHDGGPLGGYSVMYGGLASYGIGPAASLLYGWNGSGSHGASPPGPNANPWLITIQTASLNQMGGEQADLWNTLSYANALGATMVELPGSYANVITPAQLGNYNAGMLANLPTFNPSPPPATGGQFPAGSTGPGFLTAQ